MCHQSPKHYIEIWHERPFSLHQAASDHLRPSRGRGSAPLTLLSLFPLFPSAVEPQGHRPGAAGDASSPSPVSVAGERKKRALLPLTPCPSFYLLKSPPTLSSIFAKETLSFIIFQNKPFHQINKIPNISLPFFREGRVFSKIIIKSFHPQNYLQIGP